MYMYSQIKGVIKVNNMLYDTISDECGTNQRGPLSPNMFRYMLKDLRDLLNTSYDINIHRLVKAILMYFCEKHNF